MKTYNEYKDSGVQWIGQIPEHWEVMKFSRICDIITDFVASGSFADLRENVEYLENPDYAMLVRTADLSQKNSNLSKVYISKKSYDFLKNSNLFGGEIVLPNIGSVGEVYQVPNNLYEHMSLAPNAIMFKTRSCDRFYYYYFKSKYGSELLIMTADATTQAKFNKTDLRQLKLPCPPLAEQQAIADYLDNRCAELDTEIDDKKKQIKLLEELKQAVIQNTILHGIDKNVAQKHIDGEYWQGDIPAHWTHKRLKFCCEFRNGYTPSKQIKEFWTNGTIPWYRMEDIRESGRLLHEAKQYITEQAVKGGGLFEADSFILATTATIGEHARLIADSLANQQFTNLKIRKSRRNNLLADYFYYYLFFIDDLCKVYTHISTFPAVSMNDLNNFPVLLPPLAEQQAIADYLDTKTAEIDEQIKLQNEQIHLLEELKQSIISQAVTGKICVTD